MQQRRVKLLLIGETNMNSAKRFVKIISSLLASTGFLLSASPAYSQNFGRLSPGFGSVSSSGNTGQCGTSGAYHQFSVSSSMQIGITVSEGAQDDPTFLVEQVRPSQRRITRDSTRCGEDDENNSQESDAFNLSPGDYQINVGNYNPSQARYTIYIYECSRYQCQND